MGRTLADGATGFLVPPVIEAITSNSLTTPRTWRIVFLLAAAVYCTGAAAFVVLYRDSFARQLSLDYIVWSRKYASYSRYLLDDGVILLIL